MRRGTESELFLEIDRTPLTALHRQCTLIHMTTMNTTHLDAQHAKDLARIARMRKSPYQSQAAFDAARASDREHAAKLAAERLEDA